MNGNVTKDGISADLEAMASVGIGGAQIFDVHGDAPAGPVAFASDAWFDHLLWAHQEAQRLGLRLTLHNSSGYAVAGGTWIRPEESMKRVAWTTVDVTGPRMWENEVLPRPADQFGFYRDIAVLAVKKPDGMRSIRQDAAAKIVQTRGSDAPQVFEFVAKAPFPAREVKYRFEGPQVWGAEGTLKVECSDDGNAWRTLVKDRRVTVCYGGDVSELPHYEPIPVTTASQYRVSLSVPKAFEILDVDVGAFATYGDLSKRTYRVGGEPPVDNRKIGEDEIVHESDIVDLTDRMGPDGRLWWRVPEGRWQILRFGEVSTGKVVAPATYAGKGLETDKFSERATRKHFNAYVGEAAKRLGIDPKSDPWKRSGFVSALIDSYEAGGQNWGENFAAEFAARRGYRIDGKLMAVYAGFILESKKNTERITSDLRQTFGELFAEKFSDVFADCCKKTGLLYAVEPYDGQPCSKADYARKADLPMCEFWYQGKPYEPEWSVHDVVAIARKNGNRIIGAESFTAWPTSAWTVYPYDFKSLGDILYSMGVNRFVFHTFAHQPWAKPTRYPGMCMTGWGSHFDRTETWWPYFSGWLKYQHRAQFMLQEGEFVDNDKVSEDAEVRALHRRYSDGTDAWFVANAREEENVRPCAFATVGRLPELWDAETGKIEPAQNWSVKDGKTLVMIDFKPSGSIFVAFRKPTDAKGSPPHVVRASVRQIPVVGPWQVTFPIGWTTSTPKSKTVVFDRLTDWTNNEDDDIRYFSGTATYATTVKLDKEMSEGDLQLDLGTIRGIAEVSVNGKTLPFLWRPPYRIDISEAVRSGDSELVLEVKVTNNWKNRLIGDETLCAPDCAWVRGNVISNIPDFVSRGIDSPNGRVTFLTFRHWRKGQDLQSSGLFGPVHLNITTTNGGARSQVFDFGPDGVAGYPTLTFTDVTAPTRVRVSYATHPDGLGPNGDFWHETRAHYMGWDLWLPILPASTDRYDVFEIKETCTWRAPLLQGLVRYVRVTIEEGSAKVSDCRFENDGTYSTEPIVGTFSCSDKKVNGVWQASVRTCQLAAIPARTKPIAVKGVHTNATLGTTYAYLSDGAKRDRLVWSGDLWFAQRNMYAAFASESPFMPGSVRMLAENRTPDGYVQACPFPESHGPLKAGDYGPFASDEFAAWFIPVLRDHILYSGDRKLVREMMPVVKNLVAYLVRHTAKDGIFEQRLETCKHSCGLAVGGTSLHHRSYMNILNWKAYADAASLAEWTGEKALCEEWRTLADRTAKAIRVNFWSAEKGHFVLSREEHCFGFEANALVLAARFTTADEAKRILPQLKYNGHGKFQALAVRGAFEFGDAEKAMALVAAHNWYKYLDSNWKGTCTIQECAGLQTKGWGDEAHPDACLAGIFTNYLLGVEPIEPGYATFRVRPQPTKSITSAEGRVPTPHGFIEVEWHLENGCPVVSVKAPTGTRQCSQ